MDHEQAHLDRLATLATDAAALAGDGTWVEWKPRGSSCTSQAHPEAAASSADELVRKARTSRGSTSCPDTA